MSVFSLTILLSPDFILFYGWSLQQGNKKSKLQDSSYAEFWMAPHPKNVDGGPSLSCRLVDSWWMVYHPIWSAHFTKPNNSKFQHVNFFP